MVLGGEFMVTSPRSIVFYTSHGVTVIFLQYSYWELQCVFGAQWQSARTVWTFFKILLMCHCNIPILFYRPRCHCNIMQPNMMAGSLLEPSLRLSCVYIFIPWPSLGDLAPPVSSRCPTWRSRGADLSLFLSLFS